MLKSLKLYQDWWKKWRSIPVRSWIKAADLYRQGKLAEAAKWYQIGLSRHKRHPARMFAHIDLAHCLFKMRRLKEAGEQLANAIQCNPNHREGYIRLARLQIWTGHATEAAWTMRRCLQKVGPDPDVVSLFLSAALESGGVPHLLDEAATAAKRLDVAHGSNPRLETGLARLMIIKGNRTRGRVQLAKLAAMEKAPFEAVVAFAEILINEGKTAHARHHLHRALNVAADHPRVLSLLGRTYLEPGQFYQPDFATQLALRACQNSGWMSPFDMHVLADAYLNNGDKASALLVASRAKDEGARVLGMYPQAKSLDALIESLSSGTLA